MKKILFALALLLIASQSAFAADNYFSNLGHDLKRGLTNIVTSPLEIPITMQEYHEKAGLPVVRQTAGFFDGAFQMLKRLGSGLWDLPAAIIPGMQEGLPVEPETIF